MNNYNFYGQGKVDQFLFEKYSINYKNGTFIEIGALNGADFSNTFFFEKELNWSGVLIEPGKRNFQELIEFQRRWRPNSICINYAVGYERGETLFIESRAVGGCLSHLSEKHKSTFNLLDKDAVLCKVAPMKDLVTPSVLSSVDLFSIDVEGNELAVLETFDWNIPVKYILIEINDEYQRCKSFLELKNFTFIGKISNNSLYQNLNYCTL